MLQSNALPRVTVVMPVFNEGQFLAQTLEQVTTQDYPHDLLEILVIDGGSEDKTGEITNKMAEQHPNIKLLNNPKKRSSAGRNIGFREGNGDYFVVIDGHCYIPNNQLIKNIVVAFRKSGADCLGRPQQLSPPGLSNFQEAVAAARTAKIGHSSSSFIYNDLEGFISPQSNGAVYRKEVFDKVGYVDENFDAAEDLEFNYRVEQAGFKCYTSPELAVRYYPRGSLLSFFRQMVRYGNGRCQFIKKHKDALTVNQLIPVCFVIGLILLFLGLATGWFYKNILITLSVLYGVYLAIIIGESIRITWQKKKMFFCCLPIIFFTIHFGLGWGFIRQALISKKN